MLVSEDTIYEAFRKVSALLFEILWAYHYSYSFEKSLENYLNRNNRF
jgi:hypothetical protein